MDKGKEDDDGSKAFAGGFILFVIFVFSYDQRYFIFGPGTSPFLCNVFDHFLKVL